MKRRIICLIDNLGSGGAQRQMVNLAVLLKDYGYDVDFVVYADIGFYEPTLVNKGIPIKKLLARSSIERVISVCSYINKKSPDVVIAFLEVPCFLACVSKMLGGRFKVITTERSAKMHTFRNKRNKFFNWFERYSDAKIGNSENAMKLWESNYPKYKEKYGVIYNPVLMPQECNENFNYLRDGTLHLVVAASYQELKNPLGVIAAVDLLGKEDRARLRIDWYGRAEVTIGDTKIYDEAVRRIKENGLQDTIVLHGETQDIYSIMQSSDVVGLFSTVEGLPNAICEGMMLGKPIIMTRVSDYDVLTDGNGILCDPDPESIASAFRRLLALSHEELEEMGKMSAEKAKKLFGKESIIRQWVEVIEK